jgi:hypothetical protein
MKPGIFVSHSSADNVLAHSVADRIRQLGYEAFVDFQGIPGGSQWEIEIYDAIRHSDGLGACPSNQL